MTDPSLYAHFWDHIEELRRIIIRMIIVMSLGIVLSFMLYEPLISHLIKPIANIDLSNTTALQEDHLEHIRIHNASDSPKVYTLPPGTTHVLEKSSDVKQLSESNFRLPPNGTIVFVKSINKSMRLVVLGPLEGMLIALKTSVWIGIVATSPVWLLFLLQFLLPGMNSNEKKLILPFLMTSMIFIGMGCLFAFYFTIPLANEYLYSFNKTISMNLWSLAQYLDYTLFLLLANGLAFEFCAIGIFAVHLGLISAQTLISYRRVAIVTAFIIGALLTPPDVLTQVMLAVPLIILYECTIFYARIKNIVSKQVKIIS